MTIHKMHNRFNSADHWQVEECPHGHTAVLLFDKKNRLFAEAHIGEEEDVNHLVFALLAGGNDCCLDCIIERLEGLLSTVKNDLASARAAQPAQAQA